MMRTNFAKHLGIIAALVFACTAVTVHAEDVTESLHTCTLTFDPQSVPDMEVTGVGLKGEFLFYQSNMTLHTDETGMADGVSKYYPPSEYESGMASIGGLYYEEMTKNEDGIYEITLTLPAGVYPYQFVINPELGPEDEQMSWSNVTTKDGEKKGFVDLMSSLQLGNQAPKNRFITDPLNPPTVPTVTGNQSNSELIVGTCKETLRAPIDDEAKKGTVSYQSYIDIDGKVQSAGIYLPAGYDKEKTYPLLLVSHGGGGNEGDWFSQGQLGNIMDNLIAQGKTKEAIVVTPNNVVYDWDYEKIAANIQDCLLPYLEKIYHISSDVHDRAFCGLSMGSMTTLYMFYHYSERYDYFGAFSGGLAPGNEYFSLDDDHIREVKLLIGSAEEDIAYNYQDIGVPTTIEALKEAEVPFEPYFVTGSHDWFCWPDMFAYFAENFLWQ